MTLQDERSPLRWVLLVAVVLGFPITWPMVEIVRAVRLRRFGGR